MKLLFLMQQVPVPPNVNTPDSLASYIIWILLIAIVFLFLTMLSGGKIFWAWLREQFDYLKGKIEELEDNLAKERTDRTTEIKEVLNKVLSKIETEKITKRKDVDHEAT